MTDISTAGIPAQPAAPLADTSDMAQVHRVFRDAIGAGPALLGSASAGGTRRVELVASYYRNVLALLQAHHEGEDALLWPKLVERAPDQAGEVRRVAGQHDQVTAELERAAVRVEEFRATPSDDAAVAAAEAISALGAALLPHLDEEEAFIVPLAAQHIFAPEWGELPGHALRTFGGDKLWLALGLIREQMRPEQLAMMDEHMPPPVLAMWRANESAFAAFVSELRES